MSACKVFLRPCLKRGVFLVTIFMKTFIKDVFKRLAVSIVSSILFILFSVFLFQAIVSSFVESEKREPEEGTFLVVDLSMNLTDRPSSLTLEDITEEALTDEKKPPQLYLREVIDAIARAAQDSSISGILIKGGLMPDGYGSGYSAVREFMNALTNFKSSGKPIIGYYSSPSQLDFMVFSICDELHMNPSGTLVLKGLSNEQLFFTETLDNYGVGIQVVRVGDFKGAVEPFTETSFSDENRFQINRLLQLRWDDYLKTISSNRGVEPDLITEQLNNGFIFTPDICDEIGLVDEISTWGDVLDRLIEIGKIDEDSGEFARIELLNYIDRSVDSLSSGEVIDHDKGDKIAIIYIEGVIVDGWVDDGKSVGGDEIARRIREVRKNDNYKALVLRVNSPGGSVSGAESILSEITHARTGGLPVVVSMGSIAASGGYWISMSSDKIFAGEQTITGSIGVFGLIPNLKKLSENFGLHWDVVKTHKSADIMGVSRPKTDHEIDVVQKHVDRIYDRFTSLVSVNRDLNSSEVDKLAQGRVWMGIDALDNGLVDEVGGLLDAISYAAELANVSNYEIIDFPKIESPMDAINELFEVSSSRMISNTSWSSFIEQFKSSFAYLDNFNDPIHCYSLSSWYRGSFGFYP